MARVTINNINKAIAAAGSDFEIVNGNGYFYFVSPTSMLHDQSVYVNHLTVYSVEEWLKELQDKIVETNRFSVDQITLLNLVA